MKLRSSPGITPEQLQRLVRLIRQYTGITINPAQLPLLERNLSKRLQAKRLNAPQYLATLRLEAEMHPDETVPFHALAGEWQELMPLITTGESFFFRDHGQVELLKTELLPTLIDQQRQRQQQEQLPRPQLRLWSAGCSSGEEAYTLAILVTQLLPDWQNWDLQIWGTDINPLAIAKAKTGIYTPWSFRQVEESLVQRHFQRHRQGWQILPKFQNLVQFRVGNLFTDPIPNPEVGWADFDLILCRNVFIYWDSEAVTEIVRQFNTMLRPGGCLLTGHTELQGIELQNWRIQNFPESIVYQRLLSECTSPSVQPESAILTSPVAAPPSSPEIDSSTTLLEESSVPIQPVMRRAKSSHEIPETTVSTSFQTDLDRIFDPDNVTPQSLADYELAIQGLIEAEQWDLALALTQSALGEYPETLALLYHLATIAQACEDFVLAKQTLRKLLYLYPQEISAYLKLASLYRRLGDVVRSQKMLQVAHALVR